MMLMTFGGPISSHKLVTPKNADASPPPRKSGVKSAHEACRCSSLACPLHACRGAIRRADGRGGATQDRIGLHAVHAAQRPDRHPPRLTQRSPPLHTNVIHR